MAWRAARSRAVVIDACKTPPALANRGVSGDVLPPSVLVALRNLQDATLSTAQRLNTDIDLRRGVNAMNHRDFTAAADFAAANRSAPHFADPFKAWRDVLASQQKWQEALAKCDEALNYAPAWDALKQSRARAVK